MKKWKTSLLDGIAGSETYSYLASEYEKYQIEELRWLRRNLPENYKKEIEYLKNNCPEWYNANIFRIRHGILSKIKDILIPIIAISIIIFYIITLPFYLIYYAIMLMYYAIMTDKI